MVEECSRDLEMESKFLKLQAMMIEVGILKGLTHPETIKYSQQLDVLINHIQEISPLMSDINR